MPVETLVTFDTDKGHQLDNFEGLAHHRGNRFFVVSDDNDLFLHTYREVQTAVAQGKI